MEESQGGKCMISFQPLRDLLAERKITSYYLRNKCGRFNLDSKTIQRFMADESISTYTLDSLCNILGCTPADLMEFTPDEEENPEA